jgi:vancomycin aglycone glucosyltransferase
MPMQASTDVAEVAIEAIRPHGRRASIARGWANLSLIDDADGDHRMPVHGRRQTAAVRDGSLDYHRDPGVRTRAQHCHARLYGVCLNIEGTGQGVSIIAGVQQRVTAV